MKKILFCGGGSAGHVIPNIAVIEELAPDFNCVYAGTDGIEKTICAQNGIKFYEFEAVKFRRGKILCNLLIPFRLFKSVKRAGEILDKVKPDLIFSKGGYASVPPVIAAKKRNIPVITHESDIEPGLATRLIAKRCKKVLTSFPSTAQKFENGICTGSPIRKNLNYAERAKARAAFGLDLRPTLLVIGGGGGSRIINENIRKIAPEICKNYNILHVCGKGNIAAMEIYGYRQVEFTSDMGKVYASVDAAVARCGSNTAFELISLKIPTLFVPLENSSSRGDQVANAAYFESLGLCRVLSEKKLSPETLLDGVNSIMKDGKIKAALDASRVRHGNELIKTEVLRTLQQQS